MLNSQIKTLTPEEYFEIEQKSENKNEYYHGEIFAMTGASFKHNAIATNVLFELQGALRETDCFVFSSDMKIQVDEARHYTYPDISIVCGDIEFVENRDDIVANPLIIIEILSDSTKDYDRGSKFTAYRNIASLKGYILIDQYHYHIEYFYKDDSSQWRLEEYKNNSDQFIIRSIDVELWLSSVYHRVAL